MRNRISVIGVISAMLALSACNLFTLQSDEPGSEADRLQEQFNAFILPMSKITLTVADIFETARQTRLRANLGVLEMSQLVLRPPNSTYALEFPFENHTPAQRTTLLPDIRIIDQATTLVVMAHQEGIRQQSIAKPTRVLEYVPTDEQLHVVARRVIVTPQITPCSVYPDFLIARLLRIMLQFRIDVQEIADISIEGTDHGYAIVWPSSASPTVDEAAELSDAVTKLRYSIDTEFTPYLDAFAAFGCDVKNTEIIDPSDIETFVYHVLLPSFESNPPNAHIAEGAHP